MNLGKIYEQIMVAKVDDSGIIILVISDGVHFFQIFNSTFYYVSACLENYAIVGIFDKFLLQMFILIIVLLFLIKVILILLILIFLEKFIFFLAMVVFLLIDTALMG